jgi:hypothetical protein
MSPRRDTIAEIMNNVVNDLRDELKGSNKILKACSMSLDQTQMLRVLFSVQCLCTVVPPIFYN